MKHLLVTNDFPPKIGGIQSYLWELWRRLPSDQATVLTTPHAGSAEFDGAADLRIERTPDPVLIPHPLLASRINRLAENVGAELVILDPVLPIGALGPALDRPYALILHGAEIALPGRLPITRAALGAVLRRAEFVISAGGYPLAEAERAAGRSLRSITIPPGVDIDRFTPIGATQRSEVRTRFGLPPEGTIVTSVSRLVPRKGMDVLIRAAARLAPGHPDLTVAIAGTGRERGRLERLAATLGAPVAFMGRVADEELAAFHQCGDVFAMLCRDRWAGLEQEGFGIVFLEAAACGVPQLAGRSGGSHEAVADSVSGIVLEHPRDVVAVADALHTMLGSPALPAMGRAARDRAVSEFSYDLLAQRLDAFLQAWSADG